MARCYSLPVREPTPTAIAVEHPPRTELAEFGWPYVAIRPIDDHPLARRVISGFGLVLGASAGLVFGGLLGGLVAVILSSFAPGIAEYVLLFTTSSSVAAGALVGRRVLERETFE